MEKAMLMLPLMLCLMLPAASMESIPLSMSEQSVDDRYDGCAEDMAKKVKDEYLPNEMKDSVFKKAWKKAESCANKKYEKRKDKALTIDHLQAICAYTDGWLNLYRLFNEAVRSGRPNYTTPNFRYHTLHYWLVSAIEILGINKPCHTTYRRSKDVFKGDVNQTIRFGSFASTSKEPNLPGFGKETCFHIQTCFGAYLKGYSALDKREREVLIPPYEVFKIVEKANGSYGKMTDCKTIFVLKNDGNLSNLNCKAV